MPAPARLGSLSSLGPVLWGPVCSEYSLARCSARSTILPTPGPVCSRVQPGTGSCFSRVLPGPSSCPPRVQVVQRSRMAQGTALPGSRPPKSWPSGRLLGSRLPGLPRALGSQPSADHGPRPRPEERARGPGRAGRAH